ncbi:hypothetical protein TNCV_1290981 [Trichonephila clavipes]|nr:hypothetical protein TNCV_1290981 [Trichonephila clavipes]
MVIGAHLAGASLSITANLALVSRKTVLSLSLRCVAGCVARGLRVVTVYTNLDRQLHYRIQESVSMIGALTTDPNTPGTTHGGQPGASRVLP